MPAPFRKVVALRAVEALHAWQFHVRAEGRYRQRDPTRAEIWTVALAQAIPSSTAIDDRPTMCRDFPQHLSASRPCWACGALIDQEARGVALMVIS